MISVKLQSMLEAALEGLHYEMVDLEFSRGGVIRLFIDAPGGVSLEDCVKVSNHLTHLFTVENIDYQNLEVSSPGLDRSLKKPGDFLRFQGAQAKIQLKVAIDPIENRRRFIGKIVGIKNDVLQLDVEGELFDLPLTLIDKARLEPKY